MPGDETQQRLTPDDLTDDQLERVLNTRLFQKGLDYTKLADGIEVLEDEDEIFDSLVESIRKQHSQVNSEDSVREFFRLFREEIQTFTEPLVDDEESIDADDLGDLYVDERAEGNA